MSWVKICKPLIASRWVWLASTLVWSGAALFFATEQWATLRGTAKHMDWSAAFLYQAPSWLLLIPASVILLHVVRRYPIDRSNPTRVVVHGMLSLAFGTLFLLVAVPVRQAFHPNPIHWNFFGEMLFKSAPQFIAIGIGSYWLIVVVGSLLETRQRLAATIESIEAISDDFQPNSTEPAAQSTWRITLNTPTGTAQVPTANIEWAEPSGSGSRLHLGSEVIHAP